MAYLNRGIRINVEDRRGEELKREEFYYEGGIAEYVQHINKNRTPITQDVIFVEGKGDVEINGQKSHILVEVAIQYTTEYKETIFSFANNIQTGAGGTHAQGFRLAVGRVFN